MLRGHFILSSGKHSDTYLQCARVLMDPARAEGLCVELARRLREAKAGPFDAVVAPAMGGILVGYELARALALPSLFCERVEGVFQLRRGFTLPEQARVLLVEDVVTTGLSSREAMACVARHGGTVVAAASLIDRSNGTADLGVPLTSLLRLNVPAYDAEALPEHLQHIPAVKPGSRGIQGVI